MNLVLIIYLLNNFTVDGPGIVAVCACLLVAILAGVALSFDLPPGEGRTTAQRVSTGAGP